MLISVFTFQFSCFTKNSTASYDAENGQLMLSMKYQQSADTIINATCHALDFSVYTLVVAIGVHQFILQNQVFHANSDIQVILLCNTTNCTAKNIRKLNIARFTFNFNQMQLVMSEVIENFRIRWFDHLNCWKNTDIQFNFEFIGQPGIKLTQLATGCNYKIDPNNMSYYIGIDNLNGLSLRKLSSLHSSITENIILNNKFDSIDFICEDSQCLNNVSKMILTNYVSSVFRLEVPIKIQKQNQNIDLTDTVSFTRIFRYVLSNGTRNCFDRDQFLITYHTELIRIRVQKGAQTQCQLFNYQPTDVVIASVLVQNIELTFALSFNFRITVQRLLDGFDEFFSCDQMINPQQCIIDLQIVDRKIKDGILSELRFMLYQDEVFKDRLSYKIDTSGQCFNFGNAVVTDQQFCFTLGILQSCREEEYKKLFNVTVTFYSSKGSFQLDFVTYITNQNCLNINSSQRQQIIDVIDNDLNFKLIIDGIQYPLASFVNQFNMNNSAAIWYFFLVSLFLSVSASVFLTYILYRKQQT